MTELILIKTVQRREHDQERIFVRGWLTDGASLDYTYIVESVQPNADDHAQAVWAFFSFIAFEYGLVSKEERFIGVPDGNSDRAHIWVNPEAQGATILYHGDDL